MVPSLPLVVFLESGRKKVTQVDRDWDNMAVTRQFSILYWGTVFRVPGFYSFQGESWRRAGTSHGCLWEK